MHELGTIYYVIDTVEKLMVENDLKKVGSITLEVGEVSGIIPEYLADFWLYAREKTEHFKETELKIEKLDAVTYCQNCKQTYPTVQFGKTCPHCGSGNKPLPTARACFSLSKKSLWTFSTNFGRRPFCLKTKCHYLKKQMISAFLSGG